MMSADVDSSNAWKGGRLVGREAVRDYWTAQWAEIDPRVEPLSVSKRAEGRLAVTVRQVVRTPDGETPGRQRGRARLPAGRRADPSHGCGAAGTMIRAA